VKLARPLALALLSALPMGAGVGAQQPPAAAPAPVETAAPAVLPPAPPAWTAEERSAIALLRELRKKERLGDEELCARLAVAGERLFPLFSQLLERRAIPPLADATGLAGGEVQVLSEVQEHVILLAIANLEREFVLARLPGAAALTPAEPRQRLAAIGCVGAVGRGNDFPLLFELALAPGESEVARPFASGLRRAAASILRRDERAAEQLVTLRRITPRALLPILVAAVGEARSPRGLAYLSELVAWNDDLVVEVMSQVCQVGRSSDEALNDTMRVRLRPYLDEESPGACRAAVRALTTLGDLDSIGALVTLLGSEDAGLRENALWALRELTGLKLSASQETWARWHQAELAWYLRSKSRDFQHLRSNDLAESASALRELRTHPLARAELRTTLPELLRHRWPAMRAQACSTLAELGASEAVPRLVWSLEDSDKDVARAAHDALRKLTGENLPLDASCWQVATHTQPRGTEL